MITFLLSVLLLVAAYFVYGKIVERFLGVDPARKTPAYEMADGVDYHPMPTWKVFVIQFLNIAGLGPIFGAVTGAAYGPAAYLWIVVGCIFMGAVHDFFAGMMSIRNGGANMPDITAKYLGRGMKVFVNIVVAFLLLAVGVSFVIGPAGLMQNLTGMAKEYWLYIIFGYYILATLLPVDKIIGSIYPYMGAVLLFMALGVGIMLVASDISGAHEMVELTPSMLKNWHANPQTNMLIPMMFIVISCGAISGFHATQSPMMARCMTNEKQSRSIFYGAMISESIVALIWAAIGMAFWGGVDGLNAAIAEYGGSDDKMVDVITSTTMGSVVAAFVLVGVVGCAITSGDTAFRCARLIVADIFGIEQKKLLKRVSVSLPLFAVALLIIFALPFQTIWSYFAWCNQTLAVITLWCITVYLFKKGKPVVIAMIPALVMTYVCSSYIFISPMMCGMENRMLAYILGAVLTLLIAAAVHLKAKVK